MNLIKVIGLIVVLSIIFAFLERKYELCARYEYYRSFKYIIILGAILSVICLGIIEFIAKDYLKNKGINIEILQAALVVPLFFYSWIKTEIKQRNLLKEKEKRIEEKIDFCYYCGSTLDKSNMCPSCGREIEE
jgi:hypothetical protein